MVLTNSWFLPETGRKRPPVNIALAQIGAASRTRGREPETRKRRKHGQLRSCRRREALTGGRERLRGKGLAPQVGLEPTTLRLTAECSTIELLRSSGCRFYLIKPARFCQRARGFLYFSLVAKEIQDAQILVWRLAAVGLGCPGAERRERRRVDHLRRRSRQHAVFAAGSDQCRQLQ